VINRASPFTHESAVLKVRLAEDAWNSRDPERVALAYTPNSQWRNRSEFVNGRQEIVAFLTRKWATAYSESKLFSRGDLMAIEQGKKPIAELSFSQQLGEYLERVQSSQYKTTVGEVSKKDGDRITVAYFDGDRYGITHPNASESELNKAIEKYCIQKEGRWGEWHQDSSGQPERGELNHGLKNHVSVAFLAGHMGSVSRLRNEAGPAIDIESEVLPTPTPPRLGENGKSQLSLLKRAVS
jgi:hypothetical protein